eukprot:TRINITY_DN40275_c0_g1_i1.p1 TRINITY_DN40275_c0_g1~~TRINITY_DN40275_c0_g1_i1.p1  ORF type:complete len:675 (-),score=122.01 TRINITY_DN40275_c0_g1_i1:2331-4355(-)
MVSTTLTKSHSGHPPSKNVGRKSNPPPQKRPITRQSIMSASVPPSSTTPASGSTTHDRRTSHRQTGANKPVSPFHTYNGNDPDSNAQLVSKYREYVSDGFRPADFMSKEEEIRLEDIAKNHVPRTLREAVDTIEVLKIPKKTMLAALRTMNVKVTELRIVYCREILATKLVQRQLCMSTVLDCMDDFDIKNPSFANESHHRLRKLPETFARGPDKKKKAENCVFWLSGDMPLYDDNREVVPGMPPLEEVIARIERQKSKPEPGALEGAPQDAPQDAPQGGPEDAPRGATEGHPESAPLPEEAKQDVEHCLPPPDFGNLAAEETQDDNSEISDDVQPFGDGEYCRLLHVLADKRVAPHLNQLRDPELKEKPWTLHVAPIFNDKKFRPVPIKHVSGGVKRKDIIGMYPRFICERDGETLQQKFAEFKSLYRAAVRGYVQFGDDKAQTFADFCQSKRYIMYAFCLLEKLPQLEPLTLKPDETRTEVRKEAASSSKRTITLVDLDGEDDLADIPATPVAKRAKAAMLGDKERDELRKIIEGGIPDDLGNTYSDQPGFNPQMTKSEEIQWREREEKDKAVYDAIARTGGMGSEGLLWCLLRSASGSAKFMEIEDRLREKILTELKHAQDSHLVSLLSGLREARTLLADTRDPHEAALLARAKNHMLSNLRSNLRRRQER